jgi:hypothetical protein
LGEGSPGILSDLIAMSWLFGEDSRGRAAKAQ